MLLGLPEFKLTSANSVEEACALLSKHGERAMVFAGGTDLLVKMKHRRTVPEHLVNIKGIPNLDAIVHDEHGGLRIGALALVQAVETSQVVGKKFRVLKQAAEVLGTSQIRNVATIGGNLANASPSAEFAPSLLTLGASVRCVGSEGERTVPIGELFVSPGKTSLERDELITSVQVPDLPLGADCIYVKHSLRRMDVAIASAAVYVLLEGDICRDVRIALGAVGPVPFRATKAEQCMRGERLAANAVESELLEAVAQEAANESFPIDDFRGYATYRRKLVRMLVGKGLERLIANTRA